MNDDLARSEHPVAKARESQPRGGESTEEVGIRDFLSFAVGDEQYALPLSAVREIMKPPVVTEVPGAPRNVLGIVSVRGRVITLIDLRRKLKMREPPITVRARVILVDKGEEVLGLLVDSVAQVYRLREDEVELALVMGRDLAEYVMGIGRPSRHYAENTGRSSVEESELSHRQSGERGDFGTRSEMLILLDPVALLKG